MREKNKAVDLNHKIIKGKITVDVLIPARGGSKGLPRKNIKLINGKPLIYWSIMAAQNTKAVNNIYVSTDDEDIAYVSKEFGANVIERPAAISTDVATTESSISHFVEITKDFKFSRDICLLQCTSPVRNPYRIHKMYRQFIDQKYDSILTVSNEHAFYWSASGEAVNYQPKARPRRQDIKESDYFFKETGSIYIFNRQGFEKSGSRLFGKIGIHVVPVEESFEIDNLFDFKLCEFLLKEADLETN